MNAASKPATDCHHLVLLDWDDTLMPSTYLIEHIDHVVDPETNRMVQFAVKDGSKMKDIQRNLRATGTAALALLKKLHSILEGDDIKIVTNGVAGWLWNSLRIAGTLCPIYRDVEAFLLRERTEIIFARNQSPSLDHNYWKLMSFNQILWRHFGLSPAVGPLPPLNVVTIGDQWTDHCSIEQSLTFQSHRSAISHHQIKLFEAADCRYLAVELKYIVGLLDQPVLFQFAGAASKTEGIVLEFDGYTQSDDMGSDSESPDTPKSPLTAHDDDDDDNDGNDGNE